MNNEYSFESVDQHIQDIDMDTLTASSKATTESTSGACEAYHAIRPVLILISQAPFIPKKWRDVLKVFIQIMDGVCPS